MRVLVVGNGGREHALVWKLAQSRRVSKIYCTLGNAGIANIAEIVDINPADIAGVLEFAASMNIDLTVVGPEQMVSDGIVDLFEERGLQIFGVSKAASRLESSKIYSKEMMRRCNIPTARFEIFTDMDDALKYVKIQDRPLVVKADGLAAGKGVIMAADRQEAEDAVRLMMGSRAFGKAGEKIVIEECLQGREATFLAFTDGETVSVMPSSQDHKRVFDGDKGKNTGGMGAFSPSPLIDSAMEKRVVETVIKPVLSGMKADGIVYKGVIYAGLMISADGNLNVLEFNCRFGDPEAEAVIPRLKTDLVDIMEAVTGGNLAKINIEWHTGPSVCIVLCSGGYPDAFPTGIPIGLGGPDIDDQTMVFHAGTELKAGRVVTRGGRVLVVTALGNTVSDARAKCYNRIEKIKFDGMHFRKDIGIV